MADVDLDDDFLRLCLTFDQIIDTKSFSIYQRKQ